MSRETRIQLIEDTGKMIVLEGTSNDSRSVVIGRYYYDDRTLRIWKRYGTLESTEPIIDAMKRYLKIKQHHVRRVVNF